MKKDFATYRIAFKALIEKDNEFLFLTPSKRKNFLDLPGGRADNDEYKVPLKKILEREVKEELGDDIKYILGDLIFQYRRHNNLINIYTAKYISGLINLSSEHCDYKWIDPNKYRFKREDFYTKEEYQAFKEYFKKKGFKLQY